MHISPGGKAQTCASPFNSGGFQIMSFNDLPFFFGSAAGGFVLMAAVGIQAAVALFSSIPLTRRHKETCPDFNTRAAFRRVAQVSSLSIILCAVVTALIIHFGSTAVIAGYGLGFILAFALNLKRMSPNDEQNQKSYEESYADCYPSSDANPDDTAAGGSGS
ncbi:hypothetical protein OBV_06090 [Oscillibacter valericigenes Sjm18-20]|nr:hypothetical protein OBV_06090 [Oscillibacter valericigenes Sjm18-20]